jgi:hypothetical protein
MSMGVRKSGGNVMGRERDWQGDGEGARCNGNVVRDIQKQVYGI